MAKQTEKILVADGDAAALDLVAEQVLVPLGYQVAKAADGPTALRMALQLLPDILITALDLPGLSGRDLLAALRTQGSESIVIATGPKGSEAQVLQAFRLGAKDYLTKPLREAEVVSAMDHALQELRLRRDREQLSQKLSVANLQLEKRVKELTTLYGIGKAVTAITDLNQVLNRVLEGALFATEAEVGWLLLAEEGGHNLILRASKNLPNPNLSGIKLNQPWDDGLSSLLMMSGEGITIAGEPLAKMRAGQVAKSAAAMPIKIKDQVMGVIAVGNRSGRAFGERDLAMLSAVTDYASIALVNARLFHELEGRARVLQKSYEDVSAGARQKDELVVGVGREVRAPLVQAREFLTQVTSGHAGKLTPQQTELLRQALERLEALQRLVTDMSTIGDAAIHPPQLRPVALTDLIKQTVTRLSNETKQNQVALSVEVPSAPLKARADAAQISRVLENLILNSVRFSPRGGQVTVRLRDSGDGMLQVSVADNGMGIPAEKLGRIWEKFHQVEGPADHTASGASLGLAVVKQIVEAHGGHVWADSELGRGSTFYFSLFKEK